MIGKMGRRAWMAAGAAAALASMARAFADTTPFIMFASGRPAGPVEQHQPAVLSAGSFAAAVRTQVEDCGNEVLVLINIPGLHASDLAREADGMPLLKQYITAADEHLVVPYGHGTVDLAAVAESVRAQCHSELWHVDAERRAERRGGGLTSDGKHPTYDKRTGQVIVVDMPALDTREQKGSQLAYCGMLSRAVELGAKRADNFIHSILSSLPGNTRHMVAIASTPLETVAGDDELASVPQQLHRRSQAGHALGKRDDSANTVTPSGLFTRYQYFSPGIWMAYMVLLPILLPAIFIGVKVIGSMQIPLSAFEPPRGSNAKKQQ